MWLKWLKWLKSGVRISDILFLQVTFSTQSLSAVYSHQSLNHTQMHSIIGHVLVTTKWRQHWNNECWTSLSTHINTLPLERRWKMFFDLDHGWQHLSHTSRKWHHTQGLFEVFELPVGGADLAVHGVDLIEQRVQRNVLVVDLRLQSQTQILQTAQTQRHFIWRQKTKHTSDPGCERPDQGARETLVFLTEVAVQLLMCGPQLFVLWISVLIGWSIIQGSRSSESCSSKHMWFWWTGINGDGRFWNTAKNDFLPQYLCLVFQ